MAVKATPIFGIEIFKAEKILALCQDFNGYYPLQTMYSMYFKEGVLHLLSEISHDSNRLFCMLLNEFDYRNEVHRNFLQQFLYDMDIENVLCKLDWYPRIYAMVENRLSGKYIPIYGVSASSSSVEYDASVVYGKGDDAKKPRLS
jgi:hypothetical protein